MRDIYLIGKDIEAEWKRPYYGAVPYLIAMRTLNKATDMYGNETGESIVSYFLSNASTFKGEKAKVLKAELKKLLQN